MVTVYFKSNANCVFIVIFTLTIVTSPPAAVPISSLDPVVLVEGQSYRQAASCRSVARPPPPPHLGHRPERPGGRPLLRQRGGLLALLPAPPEEHERQDAGLPGVAPHHDGPPQAHQPAGGAL